jgi:hypothetical protein
MEKPHQKAARVFYVTGLAGSYAELEFGPVVMILDTVAGETRFEWWEDGACLLESNRISAQAAWPVYDALATTCEEQSNPFIAPEGAEVWRHYVDAGEWRLS